MLRRENGELTIDISMMLQMLLHHWTIIVGATVGCAIIGFCISTFFISPTYSASADMLVNNNQEVTDLTTITSSDLTASTNLVDTYSVILKSHRVLEQVIKDLKLDLTYKQLSSMVSVSAVDETQVMRITARDGSAKEALAIVTDIVDMAPEIIIEAAKVGSVDIVDEPYTTGQRVAPSRSRYTIIYALVGLIASIAFLIIREILNNKIKTEDDLRATLNLQILGVIPLDTASENTKKK